MFDERERERESKEGIGEGKLRRAWKRELNSHKLFLVTNALCSIDM
jgi:hypothetical protein